MALYPILRNTKGSALTFNEMDSNLTWLSANLNGNPNVYITGSSVNITGSTNIIGDLTVRGTGSFDVLIMNYFSSSVIYASGSTKFGDTSDDTHQYTGSVTISGSFILPRVGSVSSYTSLTQGFFTYVTASGGGEGAWQYTNTYGWVQLLHFSSSISASQIAGLSLDNSRIVTGSVTASVGLGLNAFNLVSGSNTLFTVSNSGSVTSLGGFTGSLQGTSSWAQYVNASGVIGLNLSRISTGSISASVDTNISASFRIVSGSNTIFNVNSIGRTWIGNGTSTDAGYQLDVAGTAQIQDTLRLPSASISYGAATGTPLQLRITQPTGISSYAGISIGHQNSTVSGSITVVGGRNTLSDSPHVVYGQSNTVNNSNSIVLGTSNVITSSAGSGQILIGFNNVSNQYTNNGQNWGIFIGSSNDNNSFYGGGLIGTNLKYYANNQLAFGGNSSNVDFTAKDIYFGYGVRNENIGVNSNNGHGPNITINTSQAYTSSDATNRNGGSVIIRGGQGTGTGSAGDVVFATPVTGSDGTTLQSYINRWWVKGHTGTLSNTFTVPIGSILYITSSNAPLLSISGSGQQVISSPIMILSGSNSGYLISQSFSQSSAPFSRLVGVNITPTFFSTTASQTETALRVSPVFTGSYTGSLMSNIIVDFGTSTSGSILLIDDITSGSVYTVNDYYGLPVLEVMSDAQVNMYDYPYAVFNKSGSYLNLGLPATYAVDSAVNMRADVVMDEGLGFSTRTAQGNGTTLNDSTASLYTYTFGAASGSVFISAIVTGYDSASRDMISGEIKASIRYKANAAAIVGTNFRYINADNNFVNFDIVASSNTAVLKAYGTGSRTYVWGATITTQII